ncbi:MAG: SAM-dependent methyltransferase [Chitinispirillaceae bacterium]
MQIMVTDREYRYTSPAGRECMLAAARFAAVNPSSRVLDLGCGLGAAASLLAKEFRCRVVAVDNRPELAEATTEYSIKKGVSHLVSVHDSDPFEIDFSDDPFDLIIVEGNFIPPHKRQPLFQKLSQWLLPRGWISFADLIFTVAESPTEIRLTFGEDQKNEPKEDFFLELIKETQMDLHFKGLVPPSSWDNYYTHMAHRLADRRGFFSDPMVKYSLHKKIDTFYRYKGLKYLGFLFCIARRKN